MPEMPVTLRPNNLLSWRKVDKFAKRRISDGFEKRSRSRPAGRDSELERANRKSITNFSADIRRMSNPEERGVLGVLCSDDG